MSRVISDNPWQVAVVVAALLALACTTHSPTPDTSGDSSLEGPELLVLGTAQDGGLPHAGCACPNCEAARQDPERVRRIASLALRLGDGRVFLIDATPDIREQLDALRALEPAPPAAVDRAPVDGLFLTHAHLGHYTGLAFFGFESMHTNRLPVFCTPRMADYLEVNGPWSQLVRLENIVVQRVEPGSIVKLSEDLAVRLITVPHRDEYSDTVGVQIFGPQTTVLYVPDTDGWQTWDPGLLETLDGVDWALLDATFYSLDELPGRDLSDVPHPLVTQTMDLLEPLVRDGRLRVAFTHLNHSNPAVVPDGPERAAIEARGFTVLEDGQRIPL
jgi:pyrroloquinoline quinone biosynthesis protein B